MGYNRRNNNMKRYLLIIAFISLMIGMNAQEHLSFKGIPIDGSLSQFVNKLEQEGYALVYTNDEGDACVLRGTFAGYSNCNVYVISTEKSHIVWDVTVMLPEQTSWYRL